MVRKLYLQLHENRSVLSTSNVSGSQKSKKVNNEFNDCFATSAGLGQLLSTFQETIFQDSTTGLIMFKNCLGL